jgi:Large polyvalent protein associated domain 38/ADP-Ribosyltransferase in polyvalent proteins
MTIVGCRAEVQKLVDVSNDDVGVIEGALKSLLDAGVPRKKAQVEAVQSALSLLAEERTLIEQAVADQLLPQVAADRASEPVTNDLDNFDFPAPVRVPDGVRYSRREYDEVVKQHKGTDDWMKAPNGRPTKLTERQWVQVRMPQFKAWFGDWEKHANTDNPAGSLWADDGVSKAVDEETREPKVLFHGTTRGGFMEFNQPGGKVRGDIGVFVTDDYDMARSYVRKGRAEDIQAPVLREQAEAAGVEFFDYQGRTSSKDTEDRTLFGYNTPDGSEVSGFATMDEAVADAANEYVDASDLPEVPGIYALFVNLRQPQEADFEGALWSGSRDHQWVVEYAGEVQSDAEGKQYFEKDEALDFAETFRPGDDEGDFDPADLVRGADEHYESTDDVAREGVKYGDGAIITNVMDDGGGPSNYMMTPATVYVLRDPEQAKSADFNTGDFSAKTADLRYSHRTKTDKTKATQDAAVGDKTDVDQLPAGRAVPPAVAVGGLESAFEMARGKSYARGRELKMDLQAAVLQAAKAAGVSLTKRTKALHDFLSDMVFKDALYALKTNENAIGWYNQKVSRAIGAISVIHPEINTSKESRLAFLWALAVTSNGLKVDKNFELAESAYRRWKESHADILQRKMPTDVGIGNAAKGINDGLGLFNKLVSGLGHERAAKFMATEFPAGDITRMLGLEVGGEWKGTPVRGAAILGPKIGNGFYMNLNGYFDALTMDRWLMRTFGRMTGTLLNIDNAAISAARTKLKAAIAAMTPFQRRAMAELVDSPVRKDLTFAELDGLAAALDKASMKPEKREVMQASAATNRFRLDARGLAKALDGQKEAPSGPAERNWIRAIFATALERLRAEGKGMTMSDLQALLWYPERRLYDAAKADESIEEGYEDDDAPDYANAAMKLALDNGADRAAVLQAMDEAEARGTVRAEMLTEAERNAMLREVRAAPEQMIQMMFEVAPDPANVQAVADWSTLDTKARADITQAVRDEVLEGIQQVTGIEFKKVVSATGGFAGLINPNLLGEYQKTKVSFEQARQLAAAIGHVLDQDSVALADPRSEQTVDLIRLTFNKKPDAYVQQIFAAIQQAAPEIDAFTLRGNNFDVLNFTGLSNGYIVDQIKSAIDALDVPLEYVGSHGKIKSELVEKGSYERHLEGIRSGDREGVRGELDGLRDRAREIVAAGISARRGDALRAGRAGAAGLAQQPAAPTDGAAGGAESDARAGATAQGADRKNPGGSAQAVPRDLGRGTRFSRRVTAGAYEVDVDGDVHPPGIKSMYALQPTELSAQSFAKAIAAAKDANPSGASLHVYSEAEYLGMQMVLAQDGMHGFAVKGDGDIVSVFRHPGSVEQGVAVPMVEAAIRMGGVKLDAYDTILPRLYSQAGMRAVSRVAFSDEYAPDGWDYRLYSRYNNGRPDVVFMAYDAQRATSGELYQPGEGVSAASYGDGVEIQQQWLADHGLLKDGSAKLSARNPKEDTAEFKAWFGDSKVVDAEGKPLVVYTGTSKDVDFDSFKIPKNGAWFTTDKFTASAYALENDSMDTVTEDYRTFTRVNTASRVMPVYLRIENPYTPTYDEMTVLIRSSNYKRDQGKLFERVKAAGHDGVDMGNGTWVVIGEPNQVKSATGNNGEFSRKNKRIAYSNRDPLGYYSALARGIEGMQTKSAMPGAWKTQIKGLLNKGAIKAEELEWTGLEDWLDLQPGKVEKGQILDYLKANGVKVEETVLGGDSVVTRYAMIDQSTEREVERFDTLEEADEFAQEAWLESGKRKHFRIEPVEVEVANGGKYGTYTLPGGENYREILLTLPEKSGLPMREALEKKYGKFGKALWSAATPEERAIADREAAGLKVAGQHGYKSGHWDQTNVLAHIRVDDRTDADGAKVLMVQELQSDWQQERRKNLKMAEESGSQMVRDGVDKKTPPAPFVDSTQGWLNLALKRVITMAVDGGYEKVAFVTGDQSADRYDLSKQVQSLGYEPKTGRLQAFDDRRNTVIDKTGVQPDQLEDYIGKEVAQRLLATEPMMGKHLLDGEQLKVGGEGMKAFYDAIVPNAVKALLKKVGGDGMAVVQIESVNDDYRRQVNEAYSRGTREDVERVKALRPIVSQPGFAITEAMREKVSGGQPLFSQRVRQENTEAFQDFANDAPLVTSAEADTHDFKTGQKVVLEAFHGTGRGDRVGEVFQKKRATSGPMAYFTSSPDLASSYAQGKVDTSLLNENQPFENWFKYQPKGERSPVDIARAWYRLDGETKRTILERMPDIRTDDDGNPIYEAGGGDIGSYGWNLKQTQKGFDKVGNPLQAAVETWLASGTLWNDEQSFMKVLQLAGFPVKDVTYDNPNETFPFVYKTYVAMSNPLVTSDVPQSLKQALRLAAAKDRAKARYSNGVDSWDKNTRTLKEWVDAYLNPQGDSDQYVWTSIPDKVTDLFKAQGYDGIIDWSGKGGGTSHPVYIPFEETQVKSAIGNKGSFDRSKRNIMHSRRAGTSQWDEPAPSGWDNLVHKFQDKLIDLKRVQQDITKWTGAIADDINVYLQEELFHGRAAKRTHDFVQTELNPLLEQMKRDGLELVDLEEYLLARHAPEANALVAQRNPGVASLQDGGSGMKTADALAYMRNLNQDKRAKLDAAARLVDAIQADTNRLLVDYGLVAQGQVDTWNTMFQHYVPLHREDEGGGVGLGQGYSIKGKEVKSRTGSTKKVVDIVANIAMQRERTITRGEKNRVANALVGLASAQPNPDFWTVGQVPTERVYDPVSGTAVDRPIPNFKQRDNVLTAKIKRPSGEVEEVAVVFNEDNERAVRLARSLKNLDAGSLEGLLGVSARISRYFAAINTQYNPVFGVVNLVRDLQGALVNLGTTPLANKKGRISKDAVRALVAVYQDERARRKGHPATSAWSGLWEEFQDVGGQTGFREMFANSADRSYAIESTLDPQAWMKTTLGRIVTLDGKLKMPADLVKRGLSPVFDWLSDYNQAMENGVRLAAYKAGLDQGMSKEQAASLAKNLTVNFNRKGQVGQQMGAVYAFFNAAMQGTARLGETLTEMERPGDVKSLRLSKFGKKVVYGGMLLGSLQAMALAAAGFDDDEPPEFVRERSLIIPIGGKKYLTIPLPLGLHVIPGLGRHVTEFAMSGFDKPAARMASILGMFADAFNPIGNAGLSMQTLAPTALDPLVALTENRDFTGRPIAKESMDKTTPGHALARDTSTALSRWLAEAINSLSGGSKYVSGVLSPTPDQIDYLAGQIGGGVWRELSKVEQVGKSMYQGEELPSYKVPLLGRFYGDSRSQAGEGNLYYANQDRINRLEAEIKGLEKDGKRTEAQALRRQPDAYLIAQSNVAERQLRKLRSEKRALVEQGAPREKVRAVEERITQVMAKLNRTVESRRAN